MKKILCRILSLTLCAAVLCALPVSAAGTEAAAPESSTAPAYPAPVQVCGKITWQESGCFLLESGRKDDPYSEILVHLSENTPIVDAVSGLPLDAAAVKDGETVCAWVGPAMTMSLPPQASAAAAAAHIPADGAAPQYYEITGLDQTVTIAIYPAPPRTEVNLPVAGGGTLRIPVSAQISPWLTKNIVTLDDLTPGSRILVWRDANGEVSRVLLLPSQYRGWLSWDETGRGSINGTPLSKTGKVVDDEVLLPLREVAEALGLTVFWEKTSGANVCTPEGLLLAVMPGRGSAEVGAAGNFEELLGPCVLEKGITYLCAEDLARLLGLYPAPRA